MSRVYFYPLILSALFLYLLFSGVAFAAPGAVIGATGSTGIAAVDKEREFRRGRGGSNGNERSERVPRLPHGQLAFGGNGCPAGTMNLTFAPDNQSFSLLFDSFVAEAGVSAQKKRDLLSCQIVVPLEIPAGMQMEITRVDYRGFASLPQKAKAALLSVVNFTEKGIRGDGKGPDKDRLNLRYRFDGPVDENYEISTGAFAGGERSSPSEASPCGGMAQLKIRNELRVTSGPRGEQAMVTLDSIDAAANAIYYVNWRQCRAEDDSPQPGRPGRPVGPGRR